MSEAPKVIWTAMDAGYSDETVVTICERGDDGDTKYIRADAPEIVALVRAGERLADAGEFGEITSTDVTAWDNAQSAWEKLKND